MSPEEGAKTSIYLASSSEIEGVSGKFFTKMKEKEPSKLAFEKNLQKELWDLSLDLTNVSFL